MTHGPLGGQWRDVVLIERRATMLAVAFGLALGAVTLSLAIDCHANGVLNSFETELRITQTRGDVWRLILAMEPTR